MKRWVKATLGLASLGAMAAGGTIIATAGAGTIVPEQRDGHGPANYVQASADVLARGKYLTDMGDCIGCHVANGGRPYAGGQYMGMPFGAISVPNITPDVDTGIGRYTDANFLRLMHHGVSRTGMWIYPAMPYPWYATVPDADTLAIKAYLFSLQPVYAPRLPNKIWFPFTIRPAIALWDALFVPGETHKDSPKLTAEQNRGSYIVNGLEHCGECHNNRNFLGNTKVALEVEGGPITMWYAPNLRSSKVDGLGNFSDDDIVQYLHEGHNQAMGTVAGPMTEVVDYSTKYLTNSDLHAIVAYLRTLPVVSSYTPRAGFPNNAAMISGQHVYLSHCAMCHQVNGRGIASKIPALDGNGMVTALGPQSAVRVILGGLEARGPWAMMPGVGSAMSDQQISDVTNYIRQAWGNHAPANTTSFLVSNLRVDTNTLLNGRRPDGCPPLANDKLASVLADPSNGIEAALQQVTLPTMLQSVNELVGKVHRAAPDLSQADIVNGLTVAYCPIAYADNSVEASKHVWMLTHFAERVYVQASNDRTY